MSEQSIAAARASVMVYDDTNKKWVPSGSSSGLSKVHIFQNISNNTFRVVARKLQDHEVVINCCILKGLKYNQATYTFHQWRDNKQVYGLNFSSREDADSFARAMLHALDVLSNNSLPRGVTQAQQPPQTLVYPQTNGQYEEDMGYRTMTREDVAIIQERRMSQQSQMVNNGGSSACSPSGGVGVGVVGGVVVGGGGHHRTSSAPAGPQPPAMSLAPPPPPAPPAPPAAPLGLLGGSMGPSAPPAPPLGLLGLGGGLGGPVLGGGPGPVASAPPPPPPPPQPNMSRSSSSDGQETSSLAAQLQSARLKRSNKQSAENSGSSTSSSGSNYGTLGRGGGTAGMASMMDEMARTLARRRAAAEKKDDTSSQEGDWSGGDKKLMNASGGSNKAGTNGCDSSPKPGRKQLASSEECLPKVNGDIASTLPDLEAFKQDILKEIRREINKMKTDIIEALKTELNRR